MGARQQRHERTRRRTYNILGLVARAVHPFFYDIAVPEAPPVNATEPVVIVGNHRSMFDVILGLHIFHCWRISPRLLVNPKYFSWPIVSTLLNMMGCIPAYRGDERTRTHELMARSLDDGDIVLIMPEGRIASTAERVGGLGPLREGVAALLADRPTRLLVMSVVGTEAVLPLGALIPRIRCTGRPRIQVHVDDIAAETVRSWDPDKIGVQIRDFFAAGLAELEKIAPREEYG